MLAWGEDEKKNENRGKAAAVFSRLWIRHTREEKGRGGGRVYVT